MKPRNIQPAGHARAERSLKPKKILARAGRTSIHVTRGLILGALAIAASASIHAQTPPNQVQPGQAASAPAQNYTPITGRGRLRWFIRNTVGPRGLTAGLFAAGVGTALDRPKEYGPGWAGFGSRYGMRLTGISTGNAMEAGLGSLWGEDPRYFRTKGEPLAGRVRNVLTMTFLAYRANGHLAPAYARYIAIPGNNFLSNTWREKSEATDTAAIERTGLGFAGRLASNAFKEFWPDVTRTLLHRGHE